MIKNSFLKEITHKDFANGTVYLLNTNDGFPIETTDTFLPYYTKDAIGKKQNLLQTSEVGDRTERWMIGVSTMSGCPVGCKFCATGKLKKWRNLTYHEITSQVIMMLNKNCPDGFIEPREMKINYTRMGEPFLNIYNVKFALYTLSAISKNIHHYISTVGIKGSDFSWIKDNITLQISLHSLDDKRRDDLIPWPNKMTIKELGQIRTKSKLKTTVNLTLVNEKDFDIDKLKYYFDPKYFFIKLSPINTNCISEGNNLGSGIIEQINLV